MRASAILLGLVLSAIAGSAATPAAPAVSTGTNQPPPIIPTAVHERVSVFDPATPGARDPFFPRHSAAVPRPTQPQNTVAQPVKNIFGQLRLRGLVANRLAVINGRTFGPNEEAFVQLETGGTARIRVHEITERTVTITISGETEKRVLRSTGSQK